MLPISVRVSRLPFWKSISTRGTGATDCQAHSNCSLIHGPISGCEKSTLLAMRAFVQQNGSSSSPSS